MASESSMELSARVEAEFEALRAVTDTALSRLDVEELMKELLVRVRRILGADTAAVLGHDVSSHSLVPWASYGLEDEERQGVDVPVGAGFSGTIAATRRPLAIGRVDADTVFDPLLIEKGIRTMLGVPLLAGDELIGVLTVGRLDDRPFDDRDTDLLQIVAERVVGAAETRRRAVEHAAAGMLERSLLPNVLPQIRGLAFARRYLTPDDRTVGGDWYDLFTLPWGDLWIVVGDVAGHGLESAVVMGRIRSTLRSYAMLGGGPEAVVELTDRKIRHFENAAMATVVCAVSSPPHDTLRVTLAGHPPPVLARDGAAAELVDLPVDPPLGVPATRERTCTEVPLENGAVALFYTDGLVERRGERIDEGLGRLRAAVRVEDPEIVCRDVLRRLIGGRPTADDVAMVAVRRLP